MAESKAAFTPPPYRPNVNRNKQEAEAQRKAGLKLPNKELITAWAGKEPSSKVRKPFKGLEVKPAAHQKRSKGPLKATRLNPSSRPTGAEAMSRRRTGPYHATPRSEQEGIQRLNRVRLTKKRGTARAAKTKRSQVVGRTEGLPKPSQGV